MGDTDVIPIIYLNGKVILVVYSDKHLENYISTNTADKNIIGQNKFKQRLLIVIITGEASVSEFLPGWTVEHSAARDQSLFWQNLWINNGKPEHGLIASNMRATRLEYDDMLNKLKRSKDDKVKTAFDRHNNVASK